MVPYRFSDPIEARNHFSLKITSRPKLPLAKLHMCISTYTELQLCSRRSIASGRLAVLCCPDLQHADRALTMYPGPAACQWVGKCNSRLRSWCCLGCCMKIPPVIKLCHLYLLDTWTSKKGSFVSKTATLKLWQLSPACVHCSSSGTTLLSSARCMCQPLLWSQVILQSFHSETGAPQTRKPNPHSMHHGRQRNLREQG